MLVIVAPPIVVGVWSMAFLLRQLALFFVCANVHVYTIYSTLSAKSIAHVHVHVYVYTCTCTMYIRVYVYNMYVCTCMYMCMSTYIYIVDLEVSPSELPEMKALLTYEWIQRQDINWYHVLYRH